MSDPVTPPPLPPETVPELAACCRHACMSDDPSREFQAEVKRCNSQLEAERETGPAVNGIRLGPHTPLRRPLRSARKMHSAALLPAPTLRWCSWHMLAYAVPEVGKPRRPISVHCVGACSP